MTFYVALVVVVQNFFIIKTWEQFFSLEGKLLKIVSFYQKTKLSVFIKTKETRTKCPQEQSNRQILKERARQSTDKLYKHHILYYFAAEVGRGWGVLLTLL